MRDILKKIKVPCYELDDEKLGVTTKKLEKAAAFYKSAENLNKAPTNPEIRTALEEIKKKAEALKRCLVELDYRTKHDHLLFRVVDGHKVYNKTKSNIERIEFWADNALNDLDPGTPGIKKDKATDYFLTKSRQALEELTGENIFEHKKQGERG